MSSHDFPTAIVTRTEMAYIDGNLSKELHKFVFSVTRPIFDLTPIHYNITAFNDKKSFFMFSKKDIENVKLSNEDCDISANVEYKLSELQRLCVNLYKDINMKIDSFNKTFIVNFNENYDKYVSFLSGKVDSVPLETANQLINLVKSNPTTYSVESHFLKINYKGNMFIKNYNMLFFIYNQSREIDERDVEGYKILSWVDKKKYTEIIIKRPGDDSETIMRIFSLSKNSTIVYFKEIHKINENIFLLPVGESSDENDIVHDISFILRMNRPYIECEGKERMRMGSVDENKQNYEEIGSENVDSWFYEDVTSEYYKGYFILGNNFTYVEKTKSNEVKVLEKIFLSMKIDLTIALPTVTISDSNSKMRITIKDDVEQCNASISYTMY